ncbi:MAG: Cache 3/Cache 2 fusion domain-containing protein [Raineya sp.]|jgi:PAS domain S-box-containing protein|nr:Cache 3/Cache 2 fusion domain-containing protein [Raineya sp.]
MFRFFRNLNLSAKFLVFTTLVLLIIFGGLALWIYSSDKEVAIEQADNRMYSQLEDLNTLLELEYKAKQTEVDKALKISSNLIKGFGEISEIDEKVQMVAINQTTKNQKIVDIKKWLVDNTVLQENTKIVDSIKTLTGSETAIFQKIADGYLRIATTEINPTNGKRFEGLYISSGSTIIQTIERGQTYRGRVYFNNEYFIVAYEPIRIDNEIKGMIYTGVREKDVVYLRKKFKEKKYYTSGYPFAMSFTGDYVIHPIYEGKVAEKKFIEYAQKNKRGKYRYKFPDTEDGVWKWTYFTYYEPFELIVGATIDEAQLLDNALNNVRNTLLVGFVIALFVYLIGIGVIVNYITRAINKIVEKLKAMTEGRRSDKIDINTNDEMGAMADSLNKLIDGLESYKVFAQNIGKGNLQASFEPLSQEDELGNSLLEMRDSLQNVAQKEQKEKWLTEGFTQFADVLRKNNDNIQALCLDIITNLVKKLNANQGGIFLLKNDNPQGTDEGYLEMEACYAYDRQKIMKKQVKIGEGLLGQSFQEADTLNIREIPQDYIHITSGLGEANPSNILIVPLKTNENTLGVIELASFDFFDDLSVEFLEKVSESIAITLFTVNNNLQTKNLLKESRELTQQMREKEEEMRQNMEELEATQEEMSRGDKETKRVLLEAKNQKEMMDALINNTDDFIIALDKDYKITIYNDIAKNWYQEKTYNRLTIGVNLLSIMPLEQRESFKENYSRALLGERFIIEEKIDGEIYEYRYNPIQDEQGKAAGVSIFRRNITERKQTEQANRMTILELQESEDQVRQNLKQLQDSQDDVRRKLFALEQYDKAILESNFVKVELSLDGFIINANPTFCNLLQYEIQEIVGKPHKSFLDEETANSPEYLNFWRNLRVGIAQTGEQKRLDKYGQTIWFWATYSPVKNREGKVTSIIKLATDMTAYKLQEQTLQIKLEKLQKEIDKLKENK